MNDKINLYLVRNNLIAEAIIARMVEEIAALEIAALENMG